MFQNKLQINRSADLSRFCLGPVILSLFAHSDDVLCSVDEHVEGQKRHQTCQTETARVDLHPHLKAIGISKVRRVMFTLLHISSYYWIIYSQGSLWPFLCI